MMPPLSRSPQANGYNASMMPPSARVPTSAIEKREQRKYPAAFRPMARTSAERRRISAKKGIELIVRYRGPGGAGGFFFWTRGTLVTGLGVEVCCGPVRVMMGGAVGVGGGLVVSVEGGLLSGEGGLVVPGGLVPGGFRTGGGVTVGYGRGPRCGGLMTG
jgi:hypothetical protein